MIARHLLPAALVVGLGVMLVGALDVLHDPTPATGVLEVVTGTLLAVVCMDGLTVPRALPAGPSADAAALGALYRRWDEFAAAGPTVPARAVRHLRLLERAVQDLRFGPSDVPADPLITCRVCGRAGVWTAHRGDTTGKAMAAAIEEAERFAAVRVCLVCVAAGKGVAP